MNEPTLAGRGVVLAPLRPEDSDALFSWINTRDLVRLSAPFRDIPREEHDRWFAGIVARGDTAIFGIRLRRGDRLVGSCQLTGIDAAHRSAELRIRIAERAARGRGHGTEATRMLVDYGFDVLQLHRIWLHVFATNERALRTYERVGFKREGVLRESALIDGSWRDIIVMGLLSTDVRHEE